MLIETVVKFKPIDPDQNNVMLIETVAMPSYEPIDGTRIAALNVFFNIRKIDNRNK